MRASHLALLLLLGPTACSTGPNISYDFDPAANFSVYSAYSWANVNPQPGVNPLVFERVRDSIDRALQSRGYLNRTPSQFAVGFTIGSRDRVEVTDFGSYGPYYRPWGGWSTRYSTVDVRNVTDGTLVIDIYDAATKRPVWHGMAKQEIRPSDVDQELIDEAVQAVLARFPPPAK